MSLELKNTKLETIESLANAGNQKEFAEKIVDYFDANKANTAKEIEELKALQARNLDQDALMARGFKPLTSTEIEFGRYAKTILANKLNKVTASIKDVPLPKETIDYVFDGMTAQHPLLSYVDFQNTDAAVKWVFSDSTENEAVWGTFDAEVTKELNAEIKEIDMTALSLTAYIPVSRGLLDLGPDWLYQFIVRHLRNSIANGLEKGIINNLVDNTGPIGMLADLSKGSALEGVTTYTAKDKVKVTSLDGVGYGQVLEKLTQTAHGNQRVVNEVIIICNPTDYFNKFYPDIYKRALTGAFTNENDLPVKTTFIQSKYCPKDTAIAYLPNSYFVGLGTAGEAGTIEASDEYKFIERKRYYMIYLYGCGKPKDNFCCVPLDISEYKPATAIPVLVSGTIESSPGE